MAAPKCGICSTAISKPPNRVEKCNCPTGWRAWRTREEVAAGKGGLTIKELYAPE